MFGLPFSLLVGLAAAPAPSPPAASATASAVHSACADERLERSLEGGLDAWQIACLDLDASRVLVAAVPENHDDSEDTKDAKDAKDPKDPKASTAENSSPAVIVKLLLLDPKEIAWKREVRLDAADAAELAEVLDHAEEWSVNIARDESEAVPMARVGLHGRWGEDYSHDQEIAFLVRLPDATRPPHVLWYGLGSSAENRFDVCRLEGSASFRLVDGSFVERRVRFRRTIERRRADAQLAASLARRCTVRPRPTARFPVLP